MKQKNSENPWKGGRNRLAGSSDGENVPSRAVKLDH